jgi:phosphosulfolactate synthase
MLAAGGSGPTTDAYLERIGVRRLEPATSPFDPGGALVVLESHLAQSAHLMASLKISMACWLIADEEQTRRKVAAARSRGVPTVAGGGPFEVAVAQGELPAYLDLCADVGLDRIECGEGFTAMGLAPQGVIDMAAQRGLGVQFELGDKHTGPMSAADVDALIDSGRAWLAAGATALVVEARESAAGVGLFDAGGTFNARLAERFAEAFGLRTLIYEAPTKASQFTLLDHFGPEVQLANVRLEEVLRVEIYRRGLHSDAFDKPLLTLPPRDRQRPTG